VERVILPDSCIVLDHMLRQMIRVIRGLSIHAERMKKNLQKTYGLTSSQRVLLALVEKGCMREEAYKWVQKAAFTAWEEGRDFIEVIQENPKVSQLLSSEEIDSLFDWNYHLKNIDYIFRRIGLLVQ